jgi:hypothetical protein
MRVPLLAKLPSEVGHGRDSVRIIFTQDPHLPL